MSKPIKRYYPTLTCRGACVGMQESVGGGYVLFSDCEDTIAQAIQEERQRCRRDEVKPLTNLLSKLKRASEHSWTYAGEHHHGYLLIVAALAAVEQKIKEMP